MFKGRGHQLHADLGCRLWRSLHGKRQKTKRLMVSRIYRINRINRKRKIQKKNRMKILDDGRIQGRVRIIGSYHGNQFEYIDPDNCDGSQYWNSTEHNGYEPSEFWWSEGNMSCDCNRGFLIGKTLECGNEIRIDRIECIEETEQGLPALVLNESETE